MVREDILGGLKLALSKGESLQLAMQSFYNAGYKKEEIEEAARVLHTRVTQQQTYQPIQQAGQQQPQQPPVQTPEKKLLPIIPSPPVQKPIQQPVVEQSNKQYQPPSQQSQQIQQSPQQSAQDQYQQQQQQEYSAFQDSQPKQKRFPSITPRPALKQVVSNYEETPKKRIDMVTIILIIILVVLLGILASVFFFKDNLVQFLNKFLE